MLITAKSVIGRKLGAKKGTYAR